MRKVLTLLLATLILLPPAFAGADWSGLQAGLSQKAAAARLGTPLLSTRGHGYEMWFYDHEGEVTLYQGRVLYWSVPREQERAGSPVAPAPKTVPPAPEAKPPVVAGDAGAH